MAMINLHVIQKNCFIIIWHSSLPISSSVLQAGEAKKVEVGGRRTIASLDPRWIRIPTGMGYGIYRYRTVPVIISV